MKHAWMAGLAFVALAWGWLAVGQEKKETARQATEAKAAIAFAERRWKEAHRLYEDALKDRPNDALLLANLGSVEFELADYPACIACLERALQLRPDLSSSREVLGLAYLREGKPYHALSVLARLVGDLPDDPRAHNQLAAALQELGWRDAAEQSLTKAVALKPDYADAHFNLALVYLAQEPPSRELAKKHYQKAVALGLKRDPAVEERL